MKRFIISLVIMLCMAPPCLADEFLGVTVMPDATILKKTKNQLEFKTPLDHDQALQFYRDAFKGLEDIKFRNWRDQTYIEDDGNRPWHSVTISKEQEKGTIVTISKDSWTWIIGTLILRFVGVFVVLLVLFLGMALSGALISRMVKKAEKSAAAT
jgi:hypothetical protein